MSSLSKEQRKILERVILSARQIAEEGAEGVITSFGVGDPKVPSHLDEQGKLLRRQLRAHGRQLGDHLSPTDSQQTTHLVQECAYEHWHRMLFARFLAENDLLRHPDLGISLSLDECQELAREQGKDTWELAGLFAQKMLPGIFRIDDPVLKVKIPTETRNRLLSLLNELPRDIFLADDSLGWVYQFWQTERKEAVNRSGEKIGADELPAVTQLFTEDYMVEFLLHNTLGAWWTAKRHTEGKNQPIHFAYLRLKEDGTPAAGSFNGWPRTSNKIRLLDPCMGSGHFLVYALPILVRFRIEEEGLSIAEACVSVLRDNLFGLELDPRCTQIAAFNLAMAAWKSGGYQVLPQLNLACSGLGLNTKKEEWLKLARDNDNLRHSMEQLYHLFLKAPELGSLINPRELGDLLIAKFHEVRPLLEQALSQESSDETLHEIAVAARGMAEAVEILASEFTLVATNVPYLTRQSQNEVLREYCERYHPSAKADLATCFIDRWLNSLVVEGTLAVVAPTNWLFQPAYRHFRKACLEKYTWNSIARLGSGAFEGISGEVVNVTLTTLSNCDKPGISGFSLDATNVATVKDKEHLLKVGDTNIFNREDQLKNPDARIILGEIDRTPILACRAKSLTGLRTADNPRFVHYFWECSALGEDWVPFQSTVSESKAFGGREQVLFWEKGSGGLHKFSELGLASLQGREAWGKRGISVSLMGDLPVTIYTGERYDMNSGVLWPINTEDLPALWSFCSSETFSKEVRKIDQQLKLTTATLIKIPFDLAHWQQIAAEKYPQGLPKPHSDDPTQWLFNGNPIGSQQPLHIAVARLLGYRWPRQSGSDFPDCPVVGHDGLESHVDIDGIVCLTSLRGEPSAPERLRELLAKAYGVEWTLAKEKALITATGSKLDSLEVWLRDEFYGQHCNIFYHRPFIWHVWDGRKDGFHALVNYHKIAATNGEGRKLMESLVYSYLGDWVNRQRDEVKRSEPGAEARLAAALELQEELKKILIGEPPYDIFVRWKPLNEQPIGWEPDVNDGVRINIRPFMMATLSNGKKGAGILRDKPNIKWEKDRGKEPERDKSGYPWFWEWDEDTEDFKGGKAFDGNRWNNCHYSNEFKQLAHSRKSSK